MGLPARSTEFEIETRPEWVIEVDYGMPLAQMIEAGNYDRVDPRITEELFPLEGTGVMRFAFGFEWFEGRYSPEEARDAMLQDLEPWDIGRVEHKLAAEKKFPGLLRRFPIVAPGSAALVDDRFIKMPVLRELPFSHRRALDLVWDGMRPSRSTRHERVHDFRYLRVCPLT